MSEPTDAGQQPTTIDLWWGKPDGTKVQITVALPPEGWWDEVVPGDEVCLPVLRVLETTDRTAPEPPPLRAL